VKPYRTNLRNVPHEEELSPDDGFNNTSDEDVILVWGWSGAGSLKAVGCEVYTEDD